MTGRPWRLTRQAQSTLVEIARWTVRNFGERQADAYEADLIERCDAIAAGMAPSRSCRDLFDATLDLRLRFSRCGGHFVVFTEGSDVVIIVDFIHARADFPERLSDVGLDEDKP
ncbi:MAG: type II toxin-antitoxin system RelE/ParE family toxin [Rhodobacterales bacterium CG_4_9_14_3_um_filter_71_31]|nr:MAG: type II toxin-antitoxin system RelE/ParE family toxin [Rhodobacterales bacterium CG_4_9_14_3_um_filter_71_31]